MLTQSQLECFRKDGYLVVRNVLCPRSDLEPLMRTWCNVVETAAIVAHSEQRTPLDYQGSTTEELIVRLVSVAPDAALQLFMPSLAGRFSLFRTRAGFPTFRVPEAFELMRNSRVLDLVESILGPELSLSPISHLNIKIPKNLLGELAELGADWGISAEINDGFRSFLFAETEPHCDNESCYADARDYNRVNVWIPFTDATPANGTIVVFPESHKDGWVGVSSPQTNAETVADVTRKCRASALPLTLFPGDLLLMDYRLWHGSVPIHTNKSRWAYSARYEVTGEASVLPPLPSVRVRSRALETELRNPFVWMAVWESTLSYLNRFPVVANGSTANEESARAIREYWERLCPEGIADRLRLSLPSVSASVTEDEFVVFPDAREKVQIKLDLDVDTRVSPHLTRFSRRGFWCDLEVRREDLANLPNLLAVSLAGFGMQFTVPGRLVDIERRGDGSSCQVRYCFQDDPDGVLLGMCEDFTHRLASWQAALIVTGEKDFVDPPPLFVVPEPSEAEAGTSCRPVTSRETLTGSI